MVDCCPAGTPARHHVDGTLLLAWTEPADVTGQLSGRHAGIVFVADDLAAWLISILADAGRRRLATLGLGNEQERALRSAATAAVQRTAAELRPGDEERAEQLAMVVSQVFGEPVPGDLLAGRATMLEALQVGVAGQLAVLDDAGLTGTGQSSADVLGVPGAVVAQKLTMHLLQEIMSRGPRGGPLEPLSNQLNHDKSHLQGLRVEGMVDRLDDKLVEVLARMGSTRAVAAVPTALAQLPAATPGFTGRDDELTLLAGLLDSAGPSGPVMVSAVAGMAGVGKTALAVQAGHAARKRGWFSGGVLFIDLHGYDQVPVEPGQALEALLRALRVPDEHIPPTVEERAGLYRSVLARMNDPVLVIADNASFEAQVRPLLPGAGPHKVLVTSRQTLANVGARLVDVTVLNDQAAVDLLDTALHAARADDDRISGDQQGADRLAGLCDGLPLALQIVGALLKGDPALSTSELADQLADETERLPTLRYDDGSGMAGPSVAAAFELSYHRLEEIVARVFRLLPVSPGPDFSNEVAAVLADLPTSRVRRLLVGLAAAHLIEAAPGRPGRWRMHDLVRLYAQQLSGEHAEADRREQAWDRLFAYYMDRVSAADDHLRALPGIDGPDVFTGREAALAWLDSERASLVAAVAIAAIVNWLDRPSPDRRVITISQLCDAVSKRHRHLGEEQEPGQRAEPGGRAGQRHLGIPGGQRPAAGCHQQAAAAAEPPQRERGERHPGYARGQQRRARPALAGRLAAIRVRSRGGCGTGLLPGAGARRVLGGLQVPLEPCPRRSFLSSADPGEDRCQQPQRPGEPGVP